MTSNIKFSDTGSASPNTRNNNDSKNIQNFTNTTIQQSIKTESNCITQMLANMNPKDSQRYRKYTNKSNSPRPLVLQSQNKKIPDSPIDPPPISPQLIYPYKNSESGNQ